MKNFVLFLSIFFASFTLPLTAQTFNKGSLLVSISEGTTFTSYTTSNINGNKEVIHKGNVIGDRDPITVEYGLSKHWGIGINMGGDILKVSSSSYYNVQTPQDQVKVITSELTVDGHYHFFVTKRTDFSAFLSMGVSSVTFKGQSGDASYEYNAGGHIARIGTQIRYYPFRRFGIHGMMSVYSASCSPQGVNGGTVATNYATGITGFAYEFGVCFRFLK